MKCTKINVLWRSRYLRYGLQKNLVQKINMEFDIAAVHARYDCCCRRGRLSPSRPTFSAAAAGENCFLSRGDGVSFNRQQLNKSKRAWSRSTSPPKIPSASPSPRPRSSSRPWPQRWPPIRPRPPRPSSPAPSASADTRSRSSPKDSSFARSVRPFFGLAWASDWPLYILGMSRLFSRGEMYLLQIWISTGEVRILRIYQLQCNATNLWFFSKSSTSSICKKCEQNVAKYGKPSSCQYCSIIAAFVGGKCHRCHDSYRR